MEKLYKIVFYHQNKFTKINTTLSDRLMKKQKLQFLFIFFLIAVLHTNCSPHCDDEDYTRDQKEAALHADTLSVAKG